MEKKASRILSVDRNISIPLYRQLANNIRYNVAVGNIAPNAKLPPVKVLASEMGLSFDTVRSAYKLLESEKIVITRPHYGTIVQGLIYHDENTSDDRLSEIEENLFRVLEQLLSNGFSMEEIQPMLTRIINRCQSADKTQTYLFLECNAYDQRICDQVRDSLQIDLKYMQTQELPALAKKLKTGSKPYRGVITTYFHYDEVKAFFDQYGIPVYGIVVDLQQEMVSSLIALPANSIVGVVYQPWLNRLQLSNLISSIRPDLKFRGANAENAEELDALIHAEDINVFIVSHPCEDDICKGRPDAQVFFFYTNVNLQSLSQLKTILNCG
ncbi:MAG: GntR family transcriptional regulator [Eubacteriales bacterium]|nr:GntR family transcriptional regulator [Eubacteriales bacterium]